jgi:acyl-CoA reductase-like NAD-dependent aldehyde dehydrogenase
MDTYENYIDGDWTDSGDYSININPSDTDDVIGHYSLATEKQANEAIQAAAGAFSGWSQIGIQTRFDILDAAGTEILSRREELGTLLAREEGKTKAEGVGEATRAGHIFKYFAGECVRTGGETLPSVRKGLETQVLREPLGVIGIITPWNFPLAIPAWKIAPALAYGNTVVFKPAGLATGCAWEIANILHGVGVPKGVFNLVMGSDNVVGTTLLQSTGIDGISFTGSVGTGAKVASACSQNGTKYQLEMGGKNPLVILDDADLEVAVNCAINGAYYSTGQRCTASSRLIVTQGIHDRFVSACIEKLKSLNVGNALADDTHIGPVVDQSQLDQDLEYIKIGQGEGAELAFGGQLLERATRGFYLSPALFLNTDNAMRINQEEIFGPIASVIKVQDLDEAINVANDTRFGLTAGICTRSLHSATVFKNEAKTGMVMINLPTAGVDYHVPFGGTKASSYGPREQGNYAKDFYTKLKTAYSSTS